MNFILLPAVDIAEGKAIRLTQGKAGSEVDYGSPLEAAVSWQEAGSQWLHLVDLDAAFGRGENRNIIAQVTEALTINIELSGGIRDDDSLKAALATGAKRVNIGTAALENPTWCSQIIAKYGDKIAIGLDVMNVEGQWRLRARGWVSDGGDLWEVLGRLETEGCARYVVTDVSKDGMLTGPNVQLLEQIAATVKAPIIASGGIASLDDIARLKTLSDVGIEGAIIGKALYDQRFTLQQALQIAGPQGEN